MNIGNIGLVRAGVSLAAGKVRFPTYVPITGSFIPRVLNRLFAHKRRWEQLANS